MAKRSSVYAVRQLKEMMRDKIDREFHSEINSLDKAINDRLVPKNKEVMKEIEQLVEEKYPHLVHKKQCEYHNSYATEKEVSVTFSSNYTDEVLESLQVNAENIRKIHEEKKQKLEDWEFQAINAVARSEDIPEFEF